MALSLNANSIAGLAVGGLPDGIVDSDTLASPKILAWANFNGTGTLSINGSYNVSSVTDVGTGHYTVNFTSALPNTTYASVVSAHGTYNGSVTSLSQNDSSSGQQATTYQKVECRGGNSSGSVLDSKTYCLICIN